MNTIQFTYRNNSGKLTQRRVIPDALEYVVRGGYNYQPGWAISGLDVDRNVRRTFFLTHIVFERDANFDFYSLKLRD